MSQQVTLFLGNLENILLSLAMSRQLAPLISELKWGLSKLSCHLHWQGLKDYSDGWGLGEYANQTKTFQPV